MPTPTLPAKNYIRRSGVAIAYARESSTTAGTPGTFFEIGHISGDISISDDKNFVEIREFGTSRNAYTMSFVDGKSGSVSFQLNLVPTDSAFQALRADNEADAEGYLYIRAYNELGTPTGFEWKFRVILSGMPVTLAMGGVATANLNFRINGLADFAAPTL